MRKMGKRAKLKSDLGCLRYPTLWRYLSHILTLYFLCHSIPDFYKNVNEIMKENNDLFWKVGMVYAAK
jgi:hypothetical protein